MKFGFRMKNYQSSVANRQCKRGFSLIESLVAITVLTVGVSSALASLYQSIGLAPKIRNKAVAAHLAQEGIELVRNIRDNNWMLGNAWNIGLNEGIVGTVVSGCVQYDNNIFEGPCASSILKINAGGYYVHDLGSNTIFSREIKITNISATEMKVESIVNCGTGCAMTLEDHLFDWK